MFQSHLRSRFIFVRNSLNSEATTTLKRKGNIVSLTIAGFLFIIVNSLGYFKRAIFLKDGKVCIFNQHFTINKYEAQSTLLGASPQNRTGKKKPTFIYTDIYTIQVDIYTIVYDIYTIVAGGTAGYMLDRAGNKAMLGGTDTV